MVDILFIKGLISTYVKNVDLFIHTLKRCRSYLCGSFSPQVINRTLYPDSDLDVVVTDPFDNLDIIYDYVTTTEKYTSTSVIVNSFVIDINIWEEFLYKHKNHRLRYYAAAMGIYYCVTRIEHHIIYKLFKSECYLGEDPRITAEDIRFAEIEQLIDCFDVGGASIDYNVMYNLYMTIENKLKNYTVIRYTSRKTDLRTTIAELDDTFVPRQTKVLDICSALKHKSDDVVHDNIYSYAQSPKVVIKFRNNKRDKKIDFLLDPIQISFEVVNQLTTKSYEGTADIGKTAFLHCYRREEFSNLYNFDAGHIDKYLYNKIDTKVKEYCDMEKLILEYEKCIKDRGASVDPYYIKDFGLRFYKISNDITRSIESYSSYITEDRIQQNIAKLQFVTSNIVVLGYITNYDLTCCMGYFDGETLYHMFYDLTILHRAMLIRPDMAIATNKKGKALDRGEYTIQGSVIHKIRSKDRIEKYKLRGFNISTSFNAKHKLKIALQITPSCSTNIKMAYRSVKWLKSAEHQFDINLWKKLRENRSYTKLKTYITRLVSRDNLAITAIRSIYMVSPMCMELKNLSYAPPICSKKGICLERCICVKVLCAKSSQG